MGFKSLLLSKDAEAVELLTRLLKELDIAVEPCSEPFAAAKRLMDQHFDAILVDCDDEQGAGWVLQSARMAAASKSSLTIAIVGPQSAGRATPRTGENFVIQKPIVIKQVESTLKAARSLMKGDSGAAPQPPTSAMPQRLAGLKPAAAAPPAHTTQPRPPAEIFDELSAALDRLGPQTAQSLKPTSIASSQPTAVAAAPAFEKPVPFSPPAQSPPRAEAPLPRSSQPWPGPTTSKPTSKSESAGVLPLAASTAETRPMARANSNVERSSAQFDELRKSLSGTRAGVGRDESSVPQFSSFATQARSQRSFPLKSLAFFVVLLALALYGYSWYRGHRAAPPPVPQQEQVAPQPVAKPQAGVEAIPTAPEAVAPAPPAGDQESAAASVASSETQPHAAPNKAAKPEASHNSDSEVAPDETVELTAPNAPMVVQGGSKKASSSQPEAPVAPPSLGAVSVASHPDLGAVVGSTPVNLPKMATPQVPTPTRIRVSQGVTEGMLVHQVQPQYPAMARESRVEGDVLLEAVIGKDGTVRELKAMSGPSLLVRPAMTAVRQWRYKPYLLNNQPVEVLTQIRIQFRL